MTKPVDHDGGNKHEITLNFILEGETILVPANVNQPLRVARDKALKDHTGRPFDDWLVSKDGTALDVSKKISELGLKDGDVLQLSLQVGGGG